MQTTTWSAENIRTEFAHASCLGEIIAKIEEKLWNQGEVVCEVRVNGMFLDEKDELRFAQEKVEKIRSLEIKTQRPLDLLLSSLSAACEYLPKVQKSILTAAEYFQQGRADEGHRLTLPILDSCRWLNDLLLLIKKNSCHWGRLNIPEDQWSQAELSFTDTVKYLCASYENNDRVILADLLEYELSSALEQWQIILEAAKAELSRTMNDSP